MTVVLAAGSMLDVSAEALVSVAADAGFDGIGLRVTGPHRPSDAGAFRASVAASGIIVHDAEVHRIGGGPADATIDAAADSGAGWLLVVSDLADVGATARELEHIVAIAARRNVTIAVEYMAWTTPSNPADALWIARRTGCVLVVDLLHHVRVGAGTDELTAIAESGHLGWVQLSDGPAAAPTTPAGLIREARHDRCEPGGGELPLTDLLGCVAAAVTISVEVQSDALAELAPAERARRLRRATALVLDECAGDQPSSTG